MRIYNKDTYLTKCSICNKEYDVHWKIVNHIRKTKDDNHQEFLKNQEKELIELYLLNEDKRKLRKLLIKNKSIFSNISNEKIARCIANYISTEELEKIRKSRISSTMKNVEKSEEHCKNLSIALKKSWKDGVFENPDYLEAKRKGYEKRRSYKGKGNPMYGKPSPKGSGRGKGGIREDIGHYVRSTWEANICRICNLIGRKYEYEKERFFINIDGQEYSYCPDLFFEDKRYYYEIKGHAKSANQWECECKDCILNKKKMSVIGKKYNLKIKIIGNKEYKLLKKRFKKRVSWESYR